MSSSIVALLPAHNESENIKTAINNLKNQTLPPDRIIVIADNCTDDTVEISLAQDVEIFETVDNHDKKAGALNQVLRVLIRDLEGEDVVLVQDADSSLDPIFIENAMRRIKEGYGAVGGVFRGDDRKGFVPHLQRNEYARYARDVARLNGRCLVVTGTAAIFKVDVLRQISVERKCGSLPPGDGRGGVYDTTVLTEDNEISFAIMHLGYKIISPKDCTLVTETMSSWGDLWRQRLRWKRGAVENCVQYGLTRITWRYWGRQVFTAMGTLVTAIYLATLVYAIVTGTLYIYPFWAAITLIFVVERVITVRYRGWRFMIPAALMYELCLDIFLQACHAKAYFDSIFRVKRTW